MSDAESLVSELSAEFEREVQRITGGALLELRKNEFIDRLACALWVQFDPTSRRPEHGMAAEAYTRYMDDHARECVHEAERLWRIRSGASEKEGV